MDKSEAQKLSLSKEDDEIQELLQTLEQETSWEGYQLYQLNGFWCPQRFLKPTLYSQKHFIAQNTDIILPTLPKSGTTWLKALVFTIINRNIYPIDQSPLLTANPHQLIPHLEMIYAEKENPNLENIPHPRIFATHVPYNLLSKSILGSNCRIIYICRNPLDHFISYRKFHVENKLGDRAGVHSLDEAFDMFCRGVYPRGPFWEHVLGYFDAHKKNPQKILFLKYEDLKENIVGHVRKIAEFIGLPFSSEEEKQGVVEKISTFCSFENLKNLEVNKMGKFDVIKNSSFFRKGEVGDWANYLTDEMVHRFENILEDKLQGSGLKFKYSCKSTTG